MNVKPAKQPGHAVMDLSSNASEQLSKAVGNRVDPMPLFKIQKILMPLDFSDCSKKALQYAVPFAKHFGARLVLLHVLPVDYATGWELGTIDCEALFEGDLKTYAQDRLMTLAKEAVPAEVPVEIEVRRGVPSIEIMAVAKEMTVDLVLMSTHGHTGRIHAFIGSVASDVTRLASCPVLVVRQNEHEFVPHEASPLKTNQKLPTFAPAHPVSAISNLR